MTRGGYREGAGQTKLAETGSVHWQILPEDKEWISNMVEETGVNIFDIIHQLIMSFEEESKRES